MIQWFFNLFKPKIKTVAELAERVGKSVYALGEWMEFNIWYREDKTISDEWKGSERTLADRAGDCEDFACLAHDCLKLMGVEKVKIVGLWPAKGAGHAICCFKTDRVWDFFDNGILRGGDPELPNLAHRLLSERGWGNGHFSELNEKGHFLLSLQGVVIHD